MKLLRHVCCAVGEAPTHHTAFSHRSAPATGRRVVQIALAAMSAACLAMPPAARADVIIQYEFSPNASITLNGETESISGTFTYDATTDESSDDEIFILGPLVNDLFQVSVPEPGPTTSLFSQDIFANSLLIGFTTSLALGQPDDLAADIGYFYSSPYPLFCIIACGYHDITLVTGSADPVTAPEPSSPKFSLWTSASV